MCKLEILSIDPLIPISLIVFWPKAIEYDSLLSIDHLYPFSLLVFLGSINKWHHKFKRQFEGVIIRHKLKAC